MKHNRHAHVRPARWVGLSVSARATVLTSATTSATTSFTTTTTTRTTGRGG